MISTIETYLKEHQIEDKVSLFYHKPSTNDTYVYRENVMMLAASTIKVPVVMAWTDLVHQGAASYDTELEYCERHYEESDAKALYDSYTYGQSAPLKECMELAIVYSDNPSNHMMREYYKDYTGMTFRQWFAQFSNQRVSEEFYTRNLISAEIMLNVMKRLYEHQGQYSQLIDWMKIAAKGQYIQSNNFDFEVAQKYGEYDRYEHTMAILYQKEPVLVGIFTELAGDIAKNTIRDLAKIMALSSNQ